MKKKSLPIVALAAILGLGVVGLTGCDDKEPQKPCEPEIVEVEKEVIKEVEKDIHHYGISLTNEKGVTLSADKATAKEGETVTITATVAKGATLRGLVAEGVTFTKVADKENTWTFVMPAKAVTITVDADAPTVKPVEIHYFGIDYVAPEGVVVTVDKEAKPGEVVTIKAVSTDATKYVSDISGTRSSIVVTKTEGKEDEWTFTMPDHRVSFDVKTSVYTKKVTFTGYDAAKCKLRLENKDGDVVTELPNGAWGYIYIEEVEGSNYTIDKLIDGERELFFNQSYGRYAFKMGPEDKQIAVTYKEVHYVSVSSTDSAITDGMGNVHADTAKFKVQIFNSDGMGGFTDQVECIVDSETGTFTWKLVVGNAYVLSATHINYGEGTDSVESAKIGNIDIAMSEFNPEDAEYRGDFVATAEDTALTLTIGERALPATHTITVGDLGPFVLYNEGDTFSEGPAASLNLGLMDESAKVDYEKSGAYTADGQTLLAPIVFDEMEWTYTIDLSGVTEDILIKVVTATEIDPVYAGDWQAAESVEPGSSKGNALRVLADGSYELYLYHTSLNADTAGTLSLTEDGTYADPENNVMLVISPDGKTLLCKRIKGKSEVTIPFTRVNSFDTLTNSTRVKDKDIYLATLNNKWILTEKGKAPQFVTLSSGELDEDNLLIKNSVYTFDLGGTTVSYKFDGKSFLEPGPEAGTYDGDPLAPVVLDGHGHYTSGAESGIYTYDTFLGTVRLGSVTYDIDISQKLLTTRELGVKDALSGYGYKFTTSDPDGYGSTMIFDFIDRDTFYIKDSISRAKASYKLAEDNTLEVLYKNNISKWSLDPAKNVLTGISGKMVYMDDIDSTVKTTICGIHKTLTPKDESVTGDLILKNIGTSDIGESKDVEYTIDFAANTVTRDGTLYKVDLVAGTYWIDVVDPSYLNNKTFTSKIDFKDPENHYDYAQQAYTKKTSGDFTIVFGDTGVITSVQINNHTTYTAQGWYDDLEPTDCAYTKSDLTYTFDPNSSTITINFSTTETAIAKLDDKAKTITFVSKTVTLKQQNDTNTFVLPTSAISATI